MFINVYKHLFKIGWRGQMLLTLLEIHPEFSTVPYWSSPLWALLVTFFKLVTRPNKIFGGPVRCIGCRQVEGYADLNKVLQVVVPCHSLTRVSSSEIMLWEIWTYHLTVIDGHLTVDFDFEDSPLTVQHCLPVVKIPITSDLCIVTQLCGVLICSYHSCCRPTCSRYLSYLALANTSGPYT